MQFFNVKKKERQCFFASIIKKQSENLVILYYLVNLDNLGCI